MELTQLFKPLSKKIQHILIIDDDQITVFMACKLIAVNYPSIKTHYFLSANEALDALSKNELNPDLILLDIYMPDTNGWQFLQQYQHQNNTSDVIMLTSSIDEDDLKKSQSYYLVKGFVSKPLSITKLKTLLG